MRLLEEFAKILQSMSNSVMNGHYLANDTLKRIKGFSTGIFRYANFPAVNISVAFSTLRFDQHAYGSAVEHGRIYFPGIVSRTPMINVTQFISVAIP